MRHGGLPNQTQVPYYKGFRDVREPEFVTVPCQASVGAKWICPNRLQSCGVVHYLVSHRLAKTSRFWGLTFAVPEHEQLSACAAPRTIFSLVCLHERGVPFHHCSLCSWFSVVLTSNCSWNKVVTRTHCGNRSFRVLRYNLVVLPVVLVTSH